MIDFRGALDEPTLTEWVLAQRWFGSKAREVSSVGVLEVVPLRTEGWWWSSRAFRPARTSSTSS
jgi:hypothetical protein